MENSESESQDEIPELQCQEGTSQASAKADYPNPDYIHSPEDYIFIKVLGEGSFGTVYQAIDINTNKICAIKVSLKRHIKREKKIKHAFREKEMLFYINERIKTTMPFFVKLFCTFQDHTRIFYVLSYANNGDLYQLIKKNGCFQINCAQFYAAEILHAVEYLHSINVMHCDLKPENILLDKKFHVLLSDFGCAKFIENDDEETEFKLEGTVHYLPPEMLKKKITNKYCDLWALGCISYEMIKGSPPFHAQTEYLIFKQILNLDYHFSEGFDPLMKDFVLRMLVINPEDRLGYHDKDGYPSIKEHSLFEGIDFDRLYSETSPMLLCFKEDSDSDEINQYKDLEPGLET